MRRALLYVGGWLVAVVVATAVGFAAVSLVGDDVGAPGRIVALVATPQASDVATQDAEEQGGRLPSDGGQSSSTVGGTSGGGSGDGSTSDDTISNAVTQVTEAGTVSGRCRGASPRLVSYAPKNEWSVAFVDTSGSRRAVVFADGTSYVTVTLRCSVSGPDFSVATTTASPTPDPTGTPEPTPTDTSSVGPGN